MTTLTTQCFTAHYSEQLWYTELGGLFIHNFDHIILTPAGFCVISPWSFFGFLSKHKKALLRWLLHLHAKFHPIPSSGLPCRSDRPSTFFYVKNKS